MAMTYVCLCAQQAKDHAKMRIREVKSRLKQKVLICFPALNHLGVLIMNYNDGFPNLSFLTLWPSSHSMQPLSFFSFSAITTFTFVNFSFSCVPPHHCRSKQRMDSPLRGQQWLMMTAQQDFPPPLVQLEATGHCKTGKTVGQSLCTWDRWAKRMWQCKNAKNVSYETLMS